MSPQAPTHPQDPAPTAPPAPGPSQPQPPEQAPTVLGRVKALAARWQASRPGRSLARYGTARGALLAGGIAYTGLFSVFAALAIGVTLLMTALGSHPSLRQAVLDALSSALPGVVDTGDGQGIVTLDQLTLDSALNAGSILAALALLYSAMGLMGALGEGLRAMAGIARLPRNPLLVQAANLAGFTVLMAGVLLTAVASLGSSLLTGTTAQRLGLPGWVAGGGTRVATFLASLLIDAAVYALLTRLAGLRCPRRDLLAGSLLAGLLFGLLRQVGASAVGSATRNPLLASFAALVVLVLWIHLAARVALLVTAWTTNPPAPDPIEHPDEVHAHATPNYVSLSAPHTLAWPRQAFTGAVGIDPTARPGYVPPAPAPDRQPRHTRGLRARLERRRLERARARWDKAQERYSPPQEDVPAGQGAQDGAVTAARTPPA